ncbi:unnamed protein product [Ilex paraguariensis]|uniref:HTH myb-type domain-containing protein n=1 Tax=Ilex paraguariensis TaxID=185542 RepID=A0ABC8UFD1_9AQUA
MVSFPPELSLDVRSTYIPKTISEFIGEVSMIGNVSERLTKVDDFVKRLEEEMRKIDAFKRELPLSMLLLNDAILTLKEEKLQCRKANVKPVLEEFIPLKKTCDEDEKCEVMKEKDSRDKRNWLSSVQLWNNDHHPNINFNYTQAQNSTIEIKKRPDEELNRPMIVDPAYQSCKSRAEGRAFMPLKGSSGFPMAVTRREDKEELPIARLSLVTPGMKNLGEELGSSGLSSKTTGIRAGSSSATIIQPNLQNGPQPSQQQTNRKQRRCWSPELHRRFVNALQQLGGSQAATPKQIRDLMQVDGLTNDEVKSHLQKYRLHTRRLPTSSGTHGNQSAVVLGGLWIAQDQYGESSKQSSSNSGSPHCPLQLNGNSRGTSTTGGDSMEDEEDEKSDSHSWKVHNHTSGNGDV